MCILRDPVMRRATGSNPRIDISPDGTRFLMFKLPVEVTEAPNPILVQNWTDELQRLVPVP